MSYKLEAYDGEAEKTEFVITDDGEVTLETYPECQDLETRQRIFTIAKQAVIVMKHCNYEVLEVKKLS